MEILAKNLLILASAGSGKTFQLAQRVIGLVARGVAPERIIALTFTRKAAGEFADSVLSKLAEAASNPPTAASLRRELDLPAADFADALQRVVRGLPRFTLGTIDGYFAQVVQSFQFELGLTGGRFDLTEGPRAVALAETLLTHILAGSMDTERGEAFFHAFQHATVGRQEQGVRAALQRFMKSWQSIYRQERTLDWGPAALAGVAVEDWEKQKTALAAVVLDGLDAITYTRKGQREALATEIANLERHTIGSGSLNGTRSSLLDSILDAAATQTDALVVKFYREFVIAGPTGNALRRMVHLAAHCELAAALARTRAVYQLVKIYDELCAQRLRRQGLLGFDDIKVLMGEWAHQEDARLRREAVDFRLNARTDHWLLDEFQDTSRADWSGLFPLLDEAVSDDQGSLFIVGDRKQAIYAWRGGDVGLFDEVIDRYRGGLKIAPMVESWRSCPEVLELVNRICGDHATLAGLFGGAAGRWEWQDHMAAAPLAQPDRCGEARVEMVGDWPARLTRLAQLLDELGIGRRQLTCGVLLRGNAKAAEVADHLRAHGFDVIEEGQRQPAKDNPVGLTISNLLQWLADPADTFAREVIEMSPLAGVLQSMHGPSWQAVWDNLTREISQVGFAATVSELISPCWPMWSDFGRRRAGDLLTALAALDNQAITSPREAAAWLANLEVAQSPGIAAVQVMTIHKAKGLGFDVVILPEVPDEPVPQAHYFEMATGKGWLTQTPPKWARSLVPEMQAAEAHWAADQQYEACCTLYVALTRAKRGLYLLLQPASPNSDDHKPSLSNWVARATAADGSTGIVYQNGSPQWLDHLPLVTAPPLLEEAPQLGPAIPRRRRVRSTAITEGAHIHHSPAGRQFGNDVHALLEQVAWIDESQPDWPATEAGRTVAHLLQQPALQPIFARRGRDIELLREQPTAAMVDHCLLTGVIDRLLLHRDATGSIRSIEIIDFKTDAVTDPQQLVKRYAGQLNAYRTTLAKLHPNADISCALLAVRHGTLLAI